ncbi:MAG TPA: hypothetical protein VGJ63_18390 [Micromonosporaceae bacterium]|jgi:hypothetical protein
MDVDVGAREFLRVVGLAAIGLLLAGLAAFTPWYGPAASGAGTQVVELRTPGLPDDAD